MGCFAKMKSSMTIGGTFTFLSGLLLCANFLTFIPMVYGMKWRQEREIRAHLKAEIRDEKKLADQKC